MSIEQLRERMPALRQREHALRAECKPLLTGPMIKRPSYAWRRPSPRSSSGYAVLLRRSVSLNASASSAS
jgi:hypothetical protein